MATSSEIAFIILLLVFLFQHSTGQSSSAESKSRESRQIFLRYHYSWPGPPVPFYDDGFRHQFHYNNFNPFYQERIKQELMVKSLSSDAIQWMRNLNQDEQEGLIAWTLASAAVASLTQGKYADTLPFNSDPFNGMASPPNQHSVFGQQRTPFYRGPSSAVKPMASADPRSFQFLDKVVRLLVSSLRECEVRFFFPFFKKCIEKTTTTTTTTTTPATTAATTTEAPTTTDSNIFIF